MADDPVAEALLPGGNTAPVVRVGDTVRRRPTEHAAYVHRLLGFLKEQGWAGAPEFLGFDAQGREMLSHIDGHAAWAADQPESVRSDAALAGVARLVREFHDLTAGTPPADGREVVCHNDLSPKNTVYRDNGVGLRPVAFLDWDTAAPGPRIHDVAHAAWQYIPLESGTDPRVAAHRLRVLCDAYGLADRTPLPDAVLWWQARTRDGIRAEARGDGAQARAMTRLCEDGVPERIDAAHAWVVRHRGTLEAALSAW